MLGIVLFHYMVNFWLDAVETLFPAFTLVMAVAAGLQLLQTARQWWSLWLLWPGRISGANPMRSPRR